MRKEDKRLLVENIEVYKTFRERLINLALSQFEWHGLPDTCDDLYLERSLLFNGKAAMYKPEGTDFWLTTDYIYKGKLDVYGYPTAIRGVGYGSHNFIPVGTEWQIVFDNRDFTSIMPKIDFYARLLWEIFNTYRSNLQQQITPYIVAVEKKQFLSVKNLFNRILGFQPVIGMQPGFDLESIKTVDTHVNFIGKEIMDNFQIVWNQALAVLGITGETTKKERMLDDELTYNRMEDDICINSRLLGRMKFCNQMNAKYGLNLSVNISSNIQEIQRAQLDGAVSDLQEENDQGMFDSKIETRRSGYRESPGVRTRSVNPHRRDE